MAADNISIFFSIKYDQEYFNFIEGHQITKKIHLKAKFWKAITNPSISFFQN